MDIRLVPHENRDGLTNMSGEQGMMCLEIPHILYFYMICLN